MAAPTNGNKRPMSSSSTPATTDRAQPPSPTISIEDLFAGPCRALRTSQWLFCGGITLLLLLNLYPSGDESKSGNASDEENNISTNQSSQTRITALTFNSVIVILSIIAYLPQYITYQVAVQYEKREKHILMMHDAQQSTRSWWDRFLNPHFLSSTGRRHPEWFDYIHVTNDYYNLLSLQRLSLLAPSMTMFVILIGRLIAGSSIFQGNAATFNFGWNWGIDSDSSSSTTTASSASKNISFIPSFDSYIHCFQGFLSCLMVFPVVVRPILYTLRRLQSNYIRGSMFVMVQLSPWILSLYPFILLVKQFFDSNSIHAFAGSSYSSNVLEWAYGTILGLAVGNVATACIIHRELLSHRLNLFYGDSNNTATRMKDDADDDDDDHTDGDSEAHHTRKKTKVWWQPSQRYATGGRISIDPQEEANLDEDLPIENPGGLIRGLQLLMGVILWFSVTATAVLNGLTWHGCISNDVICVNSETTNVIDGSKWNKDILILAVFVTITMVCSLLAYCHEPRNPTWGHQSS
jgi:hypothetical protein